MQRPLSKNKHAKGYDNTNEKKQIINKGALTVWPIKDLLLYNKKISPTAMRIENDLFVFERWEIT